MWNERAEIVIRSGIRLSLHGKTTISELTPEELRSSLMKCAHLERIWNPKPPPRAYDPRTTLQKVVNVLSYKTMSIGRNTFDYNGLVLQGIWEDVMLYASSGAILCCDVINLQEVAREYLTISSFVASAADLSSRSTFCIGIQDHGSTQ